MSELLQTQPYPGATTALVIGPLRDARAIELPGCREILWCADAADAVPAAVGAATVRRIELGTGDAFLAGVEAFIRRNPRRLPSVFVSRAINGHRSDVYRQVLDGVFALLESHHRARTTRQLDGFRWQQHVFGNASAYVRSVVPATWAGALRGVPAFVCGAGPSLDVSAAALAAAAPKGIVFAADSALHALARRGVAADFAASIDVAKVPEKCLPPGCLPRCVVLSAVSPPSWLAAVERRLFVGGKQVTLDWLTEYGAPAAEVEAMENCGATAIELARYLGCAPIHLFGMDLALGSDNPSQRHHSAADATLYTHSNFDAAQAHPRVPGNHSPEVPTHVIGDWRALDERLAAWPPGLVVNVNDRGARLRNTAVVHPAAFQLNASVLDKAARIDALPAAAVGETQQLAAAFVALQAAGRRARQVSLELAAVLARSGPAEVVAALRAQFAQREFARIMGAFSLKLMPHLVPPVEGDAAFWHGILDELGQLGDAAAACRIEAE